MRFEFFQKQVDRLRRVYSQASLNEERVQVLWNRFQHTDGLQFESAVNHLIGEFTTQALPALSRFSEAVSMFRPGGEQPSMKEILPAHLCDGCRDFGFLFDGDIVVACVCANGRSIGPEKLARDQKFYDRGRKYTNRLVEIMDVFQKLPYDQNEREGA